MLLSMTAAQAQQGTCMAGDVWRAAFQDGRVCVPPATRGQAAADNKQAAARKQPGGGTYGPDLWEHGGRHFTADKSRSYVGDGWNDKASQADCVCPGLPNL
jgi:hypothetical protein